MLVTCALSRSPKGLLDFFWGTVSCPYVCRFFARF
jgi:hypothetical protein